ncbi:hypothetical protein ACHAXM_002800 [Skeletonema potamos]
MPKELNLSAYDYRNLRPSSPSNSGSDESSDDGDDSSLRQSCGTACTHGNDTVMTGDHVEAILRLQSKTERKLKRQLLGQQRQPNVAATSAGSDLPSRWSQPQQQQHEVEDEDSSSDSEGVVPRVCRRSNSRSNSVGSARSTELVTQIGGGHDVGEASLQNNNANGGNGAPKTVELYGTAMGGNEQHHPISNLLRVRQANNHDDNKSSSDDNKSSSAGSNSNFYHLQDNNSSIVSLGYNSSAASASTKSGDNRSFISAVLNLGGDDEERLVKNYSYQLHQKQQNKTKGEGAAKDQETGQEEEEFENYEERQQEQSMHHRLIDVPHYHNIRSSFTSFVGQIKDRVVDTTKKDAPPPINYSDQQHQHEEQDEQHYDLRPLSDNDQPSSSTTNTRRQSRRPIQRMASTGSQSTMWNTTESESIWNRRASTESESMWTLLHSSFTSRRGSNDGSVAAGRRGSNESDSTVATTNTSTAPQDQQRHHQRSHRRRGSVNYQDDNNDGRAQWQHHHDNDDDEDRGGGEREPYDDSDIRSVASFRSSKSLDSWIGLGNLGNIIGSNIVNGSGTDHRIRKRGGGDGKGNYHYGNGDFGSNQRRPNFFSRRASMTPFISDDGGGDYYFDDGPKFYFYRPGITTLRRCGAICILIAITVIGSVLIGVYIPPSIGEDNHLIGTLEMVDEGKVEQLFKIAESVSQHCEVSKLHTAEGRWECERLCVNHLCCFDTLGDGYGCRGDESKNCVVYSGCEVLVDNLEDNKSQQGEDLDDSVDLDGGFGDDGENHNDDFMSYYDDGDSGSANNAILYKPNGGNKDQSTTQAQQSQVAVGSLSVDNYCTESMVKTSAGRRECEKLCQDHHCCFNPVPRNSCRKDPDKMCSTYASCEVLTLDIDADFLDANNDGTTTQEEIAIVSHTIGEACAESKINTPSGKQECEALCSSHLCCFSNSEFNCRSDSDKSCPTFAPCEILNVIAAEEAGIVFWNDSDQIPNNIIDTIQLSDEQKLQMQQDFSSNCKVETSPACFNVCKDWFCCFESSEEKSCRNQSNNICNFVEKCKVAALSSDIPTQQQQQQQQPSTQAQDDFQAQPSSQQQQMQQQPDDFEQPSLQPQQPTPQQQDDYYQDDFVQTEPSVYYQDYFFQIEPSVQPMQQDQSDFRPQQDQSDFRPQPAQQQQEQNSFQSGQQQDGFSQPQQQQQQITQQQQNGTQPLGQPVLLPQMQPQQQTQPAQQQQSNTSPVSSKPPRPPPSRCIPTGDDELHTELFTDDWNDDVYDRCKRWESKYGMKISVYLDLYGV